MDDNGQIKKNEDAVLKDIFSNSPFNIYVFKKTNKFLIASYLLTEHIKDVEPLKWSIRKVVSDMVETVSFKDINRQKFLSQLIAMRTYFDTAFSARLISKNNSEIIIGEIDKLAQEFSNLNSSSNLEGYLEQNFFAVEKPVFIPAQDLLGSLKKDIGVFNKNLPGTSKGQSFSKGHSQLSGTMSFRNGEEDKRQRRQKIVAIIKHRKEVTIKDISSDIKDCSEKTIQRELNALLSEGLIKKTGERRWSKYYIQ